MLYLETHPDLNKRRNFEIEIHTLKYKIRSKNYPALYLGYKRLYVAPQVFRK
jgi:hypothetical protein